MIDESVGGAPVKHRRRRRRAGPKSRRRRRTIFSGGGRGATGLDLWFERRHSVTQMLFELGLQVLKQ